MSARRAVSLVAVAMSVVGLSACNSTPSAKRIALDVVESLDVAPEVQECMIDKIETYSKDDLQDIAEQANDGNADGTAALEQFESDLADCRN